MDLNKELVGLRILFSSLMIELEKTFGKNTVKAILNRIGQKPAEISSEQILRKNDHTLQTPFDLPSEAFPLFEAAVEKLYSMTVLSQENLKDRFIIKIKNECFYREVIKTRSELTYGGVLCEFTTGYFETALKILTGLNVEYILLPKETTDDYCTVNLIFHKKPGVSPPNEENPVMTQETAISKNTIEDQKIEKK